ncbi:MAG: tRNA pseudouridine(38-40) synthase TruA [Candidatus Rhabdochlamydia sp.]|jgi:tRNA pseudouridine38-40 synthase|nr:tRNA pseudouridine38-40 synthase [Chlamydiota bacterium]
MHNYKLLIAYEGARYSGWQIQKNGISIQALLEKYLSIILRTPIKVIGSGRTDAGVHAIGQVAHFKTTTSFEFSHLLKSLNGLLPPDIRVLSIEEAPLDFHARYSAIGKVYHYYLHTGPVKDPFNRFYTYRVPHSITLDTLIQAAQLFIGTHDFTSFANEANTGSAAKNAVRNLRRLSILQEEEYICLELEANGFLYKMVRNIVGTLLDICSGKIALEKIPAIFQAKDRRLAGRTAPAHGLILAKVNYETPFNFDPPFLFLLKNYKP